MSCRDVILTGPACPQSDIQVFTLAFLQRNTVKLVSLSQSTMPGEEMCFPCWKGCDPSFLYASPLFSTHRRFGTKFKAMLCFGQTLFLLAMVWIQRLSSLQFVPVLCDPEILDTTISHYVHSHEMMMQRCISIKACLISWKSKKSDLCVILKSLHELRHNKHFCTYAMTYFFKILAKTAFLQCVYVQKVQNRITVITISLVLPSLL